MGKARLSQSESLREIFLAGSHYSDDYVHYPHGKIQWQVSGGYLLQHPSKAVFWGPPKWGLPSFPEPGCIWITMWGTSQGSLPQKFCLLYVSTACVLVVPWRDTSSTARMDDPRLAPSTGLWGVPATCFQVSWEHLGRLAEAEDLLLSSEQALWLQAIDSHTSLCPSGLWVTAFSLWWERKKARET